MTGHPLFAGIGVAIEGAFGEPCTLRRATGGPLTETVRGVFDSRPFAIEGEGEAPVSEVQVTASFRRAEIEPVAEGDTLEARGQVWIVRDVRPDGEGMVVLALELESDGAQPL